ncbi:guanitoxin biosynthesis heme-dependent pre-guanitoxin N-hydroxylase GntA [Sphingomonas sanguinis]|uniref:YqcI/YcgG family protein n=1 Tax=Sphingomonas sanguinis TaxID=33051 RepID=A0A7Y7QSZ5_9SPHN|nr:guanitoxin biosynthesis heme-dependent pre-guanitoxin N-hydroxylase GntA [Sphingomonas sanguinis]MBZ6380627.1 YqcI/YcgG family protein [Sphingomonas sanguinis]NNG49562.1 YqcI/YcgG family protein [Sphingomonas sanguinis]NNG53260.1 YqcI/YcgG family protein [Sphingomonas sanguinis]NVP29929.1 YqcI/YcgG family protein [Sphingomonas sanguinis]HJO64296.1 guanitoxin biosynthesis heme-dependent pre-guanitoxin N-hydroxylase GntA [Sphingomonas sanguinis]
MSNHNSTLFPAHDPSEPESAALLRDHIAAADFPCVGAKAAMARGTLEILGARDIASAWDDLRIHDRLRRFAACYRAEPQLFRSLAVVFAGPDELDEAAFERAVWARIQSLSDKDVWLGQDWDARVSADPDDPHFSLSFGGEAFFVVGLHPHASRPARRFPRPAMIFNLHDQFETLRAQGKYETMREKIMMRDEALAGTRNPMLARHGEMSEARQYSGRVVEEGWRCPFHYAGAPGEAKA